MASRPVFIPVEDGHFPFVHEVFIEFEWFPGFSHRQAKKSINSLHYAAEQKEIFPILEISTKSPVNLGVELSAFNLSMKYENIQMTIECAFQGSKVFEHGGPYQDLYKSDSLSAKKDPRLTNSGNLISFRLLDEEFVTEPKTAFYDWLYLRALLENIESANYLLEYKGFTDIAFNPAKSINCQARSAALFVSLRRRTDFMATMIEDKYQFLSLVNQTRPSIYETSSFVQSRLPFSFD
jgi:hypothetical protein